MSTADNIVESSREDKPSFLMKSATFLANYGLAGTVGGFFGMVNRMSEPATNSLILLDDTLIKPISNLSPGTDYGEFDMHPLSSKIMEIGLEINKTVPDSLKYMAGIGGAVAGGLIGIAAFAACKMGYKFLAKTLEDQPIVKQLTSSGYEKFQPIVTMAKIGGAALLVNNIAQKTHFNEVHQAFVSAQEKITSKTEMVTQKSGLTNDLSINTIDDQSLLFRATHKKTTGYKR